MRRLDEPLHILGFIEYFVFDFGKRQHTIVTIRLQGSLETTQHIADFLVIQPLLQVQVGPFTVQHIDFLVDGLHALAHGLENRRFNTYYFHI